MLACAMVCPHMAAAAAGVAEVCQAALAQLGNQQVHALGTSLLGFGLFCFVFLVERRNRKQYDPPTHPPPPYLAHSNTWGQTLDTTLERGLRPAGPKAESSREKSNASSSAQAHCALCCGPSPPVVPTPSPLLSLPKEICILSFIIFFRLK